MIKALLRYPLLHVEKPARRTRTVLYRPTLPPPQMLDRDLEEAEEQYGLAVRSHMMVVDNLLDLQYQRMRALGAEFNADLRALEDEFET